MMYRYTSSISILVQLLNKNDKENLIYRLDPFSDTLLSGVIHSSTCWKNSNNIIRASCQQEGGGWYAISDTGEKQDSHKRQSLTSFKSISLYIWERIDSYYKVIGTMYWYCCRYLNVRFIFALSVSFVKYAYLNNKCLI